jgi:ketosteroid isomerase-like protein
MSQENVDVVVGQFENTNARDFKAAMDAYADDVVLALHGEFHVGLGGEGAVGKKAVGQWFGEWFRTFDRDYRFEIEETRDRGDQVLIAATHHGRGRGSGVPVTLRMAFVYTVRDGKVARCDVYPNRGAALEAMGLSE